MTEIDATAAETRKARRAILTVAAIFTLALLAAVLGQTELIDPIPVPVTMIAGSVGAVFGLWLVSQFWTTMQPKAEWHRYMVLLAVAAMLAAFGTYIARSAFNLAAFAGSNREVTEATASVIGKSHGRYGPSSAKVTFGPDLREIGVKVSREFYEQLDPYGSPGKDCVRLTVEKGRWGYRRAIVPSALTDPAIDSQSYVRCKDAVVGLAD